MKKKLAYGFLDESPGLSDKALFFCVDIISTSRETNQNLKKILKRTRKRIVRKKLKSLPELKFHNSNERTRKFVLKEIAKQDVKSVVLIIDKQKRKVKETPANYGTVVGATIAEFLSTYPVLSLTVDKKYTSKKQEEEFLKVTQETVSKLATGGANVFFNAPVDSQKESIVQLADFVAGAFNVKYNQGKDHYAKIINDKVKIEKVLKWGRIEKKNSQPLSSDSHQSGWIKTVLLPSRNIRPYSTILHIV